jgi:tetratricopeptide (TPR) repeat protein
MGDLWIQLIPRVSADLTVLNDDFRRKANAEDLAAYSKLLKDDPNNPLRHDAVAGLYLEDGRLDEAMAEYRESLRLNPDSAPTHYNFGFALSASGRRAEAIGQFEQAVRIDPDYAQAHNNLGALLQLEGKNDLALSHYERAVALRSDNFEAQVNLAQILSALGRWPEAIQHFRRTLALKPDHAQAEAGLAWILATAPDEELRRVDEAVALAERAADATLHQELRALDALAAAYASAGRYDAAATIARSALEIAVAAGQLPVAAQFRQRIELYQSGRPLRMPRP